MKKIIFILIALGCVNFLMAQESNHELKDFDHIKVYNGLKVLLKHSSTNKAVVKGTNSQDISFEIDDNMLKVRSKIDNLFSDKDFEIIVFYKELTSLEVVQNSGIKLADKLKTKNLVLETQEGAEIIGEINVEKLRSKAITGGTIDITGKAESQEIKIRAGGKYYAKNLKTKNSDVNVSAGGVADIFAKENVIAKVKAGGTVNVYGNPKNLDKNTLFGGKILRKN